MSKTNFEAPKGNKRSGKRPPAAPPKKQKPDQPQSPPSKPKEPNLEN